LALLISPADELVARSALPSGGAKAQERDQTIPGSNPITQLRTGESFKAKPVLSEVEGIVVAVNVFIPQTGVRAGADQPELQAGQGMNGHMNRRGATSI